MTTVEELEKLETDRLNKERIKYLKNYAECLRVKMENLTLKAWMERAGDLTKERNEVLALIDRLVSEGMS